MKLSKTQSPTIAKDRKRMKFIPYASAIGSIKYAMLRIERRRLVEESVDSLNQHLEDKKELVAARRGD